MIVATTPLMQREPKKPWGTIVVLMLVLVSTLASVPLQLAVLKQGSAASRADVLRQQELTRQLADQQAVDTAAAKAFREDSRMLTLAICDQIEAIVAQTRLRDVPPCPRVATSPQVYLTPQPSPSGG